MKRSKYSETLIVAILKEGEAGAKVTDLCRKYGISQTTFGCAQDRLYYNWKARYGGMDANALKRLKELDVWQRQTLAIAWRLPGGRKA